MYKLSALVFLLVSASVSGQVPINQTVNGIEYLKFELDDGLGNTELPVANGSYFLNLNGNGEEFTLVSRVQLNERSVVYGSFEARGLGPFWLLFEFRNSAHIAFVLCKRTDKPFVLMDKIVVDSNEKTKVSALFFSCEVDQVEDERLFALQRFEGDFRKPQYFQDIWKSWKADIVAGKIVEIESSKVKCFNMYYWDYDHDDNSVPVWYYSGLIGVINDPDGYTNMRSRPHSKSTIVYKITAGVEFRFWEDPGYDWWKVRITLKDTGKHLYGFIHKSRITKK